MSKQPLKVRIELRRDKILDLFTDDNVLMTEQIISKTKLNYNIVMRHIHELNEMGILHVKKFKSKLHISKNQDKLNALQSRIAEVYELLEREGAMTMEQITEKLICSKTAVRDALLGNTDGFVIYKYKSSKGKAHLLSVTKPPKQEVRLNDEPNTPVKKRRRRTRLPNTPRGHAKLRKYEFKGVRVGSNEALNVIGELVVLFQTSENPYLYNFKLRHMIETMPEKYWLEQIPLRAYVKDIDMVELPKTGAIKDVDRRPGSLI